MASRPHPGQRHAVSAAAAILRVRFSSASGADLDRLAAFLDEAGATAAVQAIEVIREAALSLRTFPERGSPLAHRNGRRLTIPFGRAAYLIDYRVDLERETVTILRIRHSREAR